MRLWNDLFGTSDQTYPTARTGATPPPCGSSPYQPPNAAGFFNSLFRPSELPYPLPACDASSAPTHPAPCDQLHAQPSAPVQPSAPTPPPLTNTSAASGSGTAPSGNASSGGTTPPPSAPLVVAVAAPAPFVPAPIVPIAPAPVSPVTVVIAMPGSQAATQAAPASIVPTAPAPAAPVSPAPIAPVATTPAAPTAPAPASKAGGDPILTADCLNPKFRAHHPRAHESLLNEMLDENVSAKMMVKESQPIAFVVPDGCDSLQLSYGPIEINPGVGKDHDLDQIVTVGEAAVSADVGAVDRGGLGPLTPGTAIVVTLPWRAASWVDLPANRLKVTVYARFYSSAVEAVS